MDNVVYALMVYDNELFVGGRFGMAGGIPASRVAKWDGASWYRLGTGVNNVVYAIGVHDTHLHVGGGFTEAGGLSAIYVARWEGESW
jgi:hypothetical protein